MKFSSKFLFFPTNVRLFHIVCLIGYSSSTELLLYLSVRHIGVDLFMFPFYYINLCVYSPLIPHCLDYYGYKVDVNVNRVIPSTLFFFYKIVLAILSPLVFHASFSMSLYICKKENLSGIFVRIVLNCTYIWEDIFSMSSLPLHGLCIPLLV